MGIGSVICTEYVDGPLSRGRYVATVTFLGQSWSTRPSTVGLIIVVVVHCYTVYSMMAKQW